MPSLREAATQALEALKLCIPKPRSTDDDYAEQGWKEHNAAITALRAALAEPNDPVAYDGWVLREVLFDNGEPVGHREPAQEPVAHSVIAGALFDFMGWLTSRRERIVLSSADIAAPAVEAITEFAKMRGLSLDDAKVQDWNTAPPQRKPLTDEEIQDCFHAARNAKLGASKDNSKHRLSVVEIARAIERAHGIGGQDE